MAHWTPALADKPIIPYDLGNLGYQAIQVEHIDEAGDMVGWSTPLSGSGGFPFYWSQQSGMINLGSCCGGGVANVITDDGVVIGEEVGPATRLGFYWTAAEGRVNIPLISPGNWQNIRRVNPRTGVVIGNECDSSTLTSCESPRAIAWTREGGTEDIGAGCFPYDVND